MDISTEIKSNYLKQKKEICILRERMSNENKFIKRQINVKKSNKIKTNDFDTFLYVCFLFHFIL